MRRRQLSLRGFDTAGMMRDFAVCDGTDAAPAIERLLGNAAIDYIHAHYAGPGCFAARIDRA